MIVYAEVNTLMKVVDYSVDHHVKNSSYTGCEEFFLRWLRRSSKQLRVFSQNVVEIVELTLLLPLHFLELWNSEVGRSIVVLVQIHFF